MSLTVKAYLMIKGDVDPEIRRFSVDPAVSTNYDYLKGKVTQIFPVLTNKAFKLFWRDNENDLIAFSSDDELTEALGFVADGVFKIYIKDISSGDAPSGPEAVHTGVVCDGCEVGPIRGYRFKCVVCPDYDLCNGCQHKGTHADHEMMRIATPKTCPQMFGPFVPPQMGHPPPPFGPCGSAGRPGKPFRRMMKNWHRFMTGDPEEAKKETTEKKNEKENEEETKATSGAGARPKDKKDDSSDSSSDEEEIPKNAEEFLRSIGQNVAAMLDPLGIDVEVDVEQGNGTKERCGGPKGGAFGPWAWGMGGPWAGRSKNWGSGKCGGRGKSGSCPRGPGGKPTTCPAAEPEKPKETPQEQPKDVEEEISEAVKPTAPEPKVIEPTLQPEKTTTEKEWTIIDKREPTDTTPPPEDGATGGLYPQVPAAEPHKDPKVANALDHMSAMGFADEGGWLTTLLEATGGDINKALDAIRANRAK